MLTSVLIANRGEIAVRIARTARRLGLRTIAIYSEADLGALHTRVCDEAHLIGPATARESYLDIKRVIAAARESRAQCIHPGYGFLSENPEFAEACANVGITFVGPPASAIRAMGLKDRAKAMMAKAGVPVVPGYQGERQDAAFLKRQAKDLGYPVLIKAVAGGGGKGMRRVDQDADFESALESAQREAKAAFGDARVLIEKYVPAPRHIEVQVFADGHGNVIHLNERDCSLQRRHQKVIEEAPAPGMTAELRAKMGSAAVEAARAVGYVGAGTVEFIADGSKGLRLDGFWFMEMNTRLQVEHPVTEAITGLDLIEWQFRVATGEKLPLAQRDVAISGHAIEARLYAEDPLRDFLPAAGKLVAFEPSRDVRVDGGYAAGDVISPFYDPMIAKLIAHAPTRGDAIDRLAHALEETAIAGPRTNAAFLLSLLRAPDFRAEKFDTGFIENNLKTLVTPLTEPDKAAAAQGVAALLEQAWQSQPHITDEPEVSPSPWDAQDGFQLAGPRAVEWPVLVDDHPMTAIAGFSGGRPIVMIDGAAADPSARAFVDGDAVYVNRKARQTIVRVRLATAEGVEEAKAGGRLRAPMHGKVLALLVEKGASVKKGQRVAVVEAMKMEHALVAPFDGRVVDIAVAVGAQVAEKAPIMTIEPQP
jgi:3-methylcrotonyl-CoA carboxylase alpha subunit